MVAGRLQEKNGFYYIVLSYTDSAGKRRQPWIGTGLPVKGNKKRAEKMLAETRKDFTIPKGQVSELSPDMAFSDYMRYWLKMIRTAVTETTYSSYCFNVEKHIIPYFEPLGVTLAGLQPRQIQSFYLHEAETLKNTSILRFHANLHKALKYAVRIDLIASNPVDKVDRPKPQAFMASYYSAEEMEKLFEVAQGHKLELIIQLAAFYGLRRAEVMGLRWEAIDFEAMPQNAYHIMQATKQRWGKPLNGGNVGYHIIQSFKPGEATPDQVHEIGCEFARRFLADRFECTVSTHLDKGHLHNHIVVNSVSFMDGRMFRNDFTTYYKGIRAISDELCRENRLSVVETDGHGKSYGEWKHEKEGSPTLRGMVKADIEMALVAADSFAGFIAELQQMGYEVKYGPKVTHMAVRHKDAQRNIRLDKISPRFSEDSLRCYFQELRKLPPAMQQEYKQQTVPHPPRWQPKELPMPVRRRARCRSKLSHNCRKITGFMACYYRYCALLRKAYKGKVGKRCYYLLRDDFLRYTRYRRQCDFLWARQITTLDELLTCKENLQAEYNALTAQRKALYRSKDKVANTNPLKPNTDAHSPY